MADPVSIITTVSGVVAAGVKLSCALYNICDNIASSQDQIEDLASDLSDFTSVLNELGKIFEQPKRVYSDALTGSLADILDKCKRQFQQIRQMIGKTESETTSTNRFKVKVAWVFRETKVRALTARLDSTKLTLLVMLQTLKIAADE
jgi:Fungal N-terminal domain of STAND proteins